MTIADLFETYRKRVLPPAAPDVQVDECRRAFYAGAFAILGLLLDEVGGDLPEDQGVDRLEALFQECKAFGEAGGRVAPPPPDVHYTIADPLEMQTRLKEIGGRIRDGLPAGWGFLLMLFEYGEGGGLFYMSSADRADVLAMLREYINRQTQ